jgi:L-fucose mutarotase
MHGFAAKCEATSRADPVARWPTSKPSIQSNFAFALRTMIGNMTINQDSSERRKLWRIKVEAPMLKSIDPLLNADVLYALRAMGHGDDLVICDTNFPADSVARQTVLGRLLRMDGVTAARAARAALSVLPLDSFVEKPSLRMEVVGEPHVIPNVQAEVQAEIDAAQGCPSPMGSVERFAFYELAKKAYCVIQSGERRFYGCFIFKKGVIPPDA